MFYMDDFVSTTLFSIKATSSFFITNISILCLNQLSIEVREIYENDAIFSIIVAAGSLKSNDNWEKGVDSTNYMHTHKAAIK